MSLSLRSTWASLIVLPLLACIPLACSGSPDAESTDSSGDRLGDESALANIAKHPSKSVCAEESRPGYARCHAIVRTRDDGSIQADASPSGLTPANLQAAYNLKGLTGTGTIAIVDAYDNPNAESDLAVYRSQFGLPPCTTANGCFKKVSQTGSTTSLPKGDTGWGGEIALDLDMASAGCPQCKILLVEANSASNSDLGVAVNEAAALGANVISNSYGGSESSSDTTYDTQYYNHPGVLIFASSGDSGYGAQYPAGGAYVIGVGGTSLTTSSNARGWAEGAWSSGGSGCSKYTAKPSFQKDTGCTKRTIADVSAVADPNTGVAVYDTYGGSAAGAAGWEVYGGTSASSPLVAAIFVAAGKASQSNGYPYAHTGAFYDVTSGSNGSCTTKYLCTAAAGYDGPTGLGTPNGAVLASGSGSTDAGTTDSGATDSGTTDSGTKDSGTGTCSHSECTTGTKLTSGCDSCATKVCASDSYCCNTQWDSICVGEVASICGETCN